MRAKRIVSVILSLLIFCSFFAGPTAFAYETNKNERTKDVVSAGDDVSVKDVSAETSGTTGDCTWTYDETTKTLTISGYGDMEDFEYFSEPTWFRFRNDIYNIVIENGVTSITNYAFEDCKYLVNLKIPNSVTSIGYEAFRDCTSLADITIPNSVKSISYCAFYNTACYNNQPDGVVYIDNWVVHYKGDMPAKANIKIKNGTNGIADSAFNGQENLKTITIPNGVTSIGYGIFWGCTSLISVSIPDSVTSIGDGEFYHCKRLTSISIPNSVTVIGEQSFKGCINLTKVTISNSVTKIDDRAFMGCKSLSEITIPDSVTSIGYEAFQDCISLANITLPNNITSIENDAFYNTTYYNNQPNGVVYLGNWVIEYKGDMPKNARINIKSGTKGIADFSFEWQGYLISITIPNSITNIGDGAFHVCGHLADVYYKGTKEKWNNVSIGEYNDKLIGAKMHYVYNGAQVINIVQEQYKLTYGARSFNLGGKAKTPLSYVSSNPKVAYVSPNGTVTIKGGGKATITITAKEANGYMPAKKIVRITVNKLNQKVTEVKTKYVAKAGKTFSLKPKAKSKLTYSSSNKNVAVVSSNGKVTVKGGGCAYITVKANDNGNYKSAYAKTKIISAPRNFTSKDVSKVKKTGKTKAKITWKALTGAKGYTVQLATNKRYKGAKTVKNSKNTATLTGLKKGKTYYVRINAYAKVSGKNYSNKWYTVKFKMK